MKKLTISIDDKTGDTIIKTLTARGWGTRKTGRLIDEAIDKLAAWEETEGKYATITRWSKLGYGYTAWTPEHPEPPYRPDYTGTYLTVREQMEQDRTLASMRSGGTYLATAWFIKTPDGWKRVVSEFDLEMDGSCKVEIA
jgi:hypothetical protein